MKKEESQTAMGFSLPVSVFVVFLTLKLTGLISWSWWWVTSPIWIPAIICLSLFVIYVIVFAFRYRKQE